MKNFMEKYLHGNKLHKMTSKVNNKPIKKKYRNQDRYNIFLSEYNTIYFFIPKVASTSLKKICSMVLGINQDKNFDQIDFPSVLRSSLINNDPYFKFAFVRNPYDRLVSCYSGKVVKRRNFAKGEDWKDRSFEDFIKIICDIPEEKMNVHYKPQHSFLTDAKGRLLVDYVGKFENINEDYKIIKKRAGLPDDLELPHRAKTKHSLYKNYYSAETKKLVEERYEKDFIMFNYSF